MEQSIGSQQSAAGMQSEMDPARAPGHWVLARLGKRVLRPGGMRATRFLLDEIGISSKDRVVEFAPGFGLTARMILSRQPASYIGVERDGPVVERLRQTLSHRAKVVQASAQESGLEPNSATRVVGEAMLSMHPDVTKRAIIAEAARILEPGGLYGIHELALDEKMDESARRELRKSMSSAIHNGVSPLTFSEWGELLAQADFTVERIGYIPFRLLHPTRIIADEGLAGALRIAKNMLVDTEARRRVFAMKKVFRKHRNHLRAVVIIARKNGETTKP